MKRTINVKSSLRGIGLDFYSNTDSKEFYELKKELKNSNLSFDESKLHWDTEDHQLTYPNEKVNTLLKDVEINLVH